MKFCIKFAAKVLIKIRALYWAIVHSEYRLRYSISPSFRFNGANVLFYGTGTIETGEHSYIGENSTIQAGPNNAVIIGEYSSISHNVRIYTSTSDADSDFSSLNTVSKTGDVTIGCHCWIGANVFINPGVSIGDNSVVGANSVVTKNIPAYEIWGGVPAKLIRSKGCKR